MSDPIVYKASELGACTKYLICKRLGFEPTPDPNAAPIPAFERGKKMEGEVIEWMKERGWVIQDTQREYRYEILPGIYLEAHPDALGWFNSPDPEHTFAIEIKTCDLRTYRDFEENGIMAKGLFARYRWQVSVYALVSHLPIVMVVREHETGKNQTFQHAIPSDHLYRGIHIVERVMEIEEAAASYSIPVECDLPNIYCPIPFMHESAIVDDPVLDQYARDYLSELKGLRKKAREQIIAHTNAQDVSRKVDTGRYSVSVAHAKTGVVMVRVTDRLDKKNREKKRDAKGRQ